MQAFRRKKKKKVRRDNLPAIKGEMTEKGGDMKLKVLKSSFDRVEGDRIILDDKGSFPKRLIILCECGNKKEYRIIKTRNGGYVLNK
jgi:hypothetical protein